MKQHSKNKLKLSDLPLWLLRKLTKLLKPQEEPKKKSRLLLTRDKWQQDDLPLKKHLEMCGPPEIQVFH